jgi:Sugar-transfer associated ATP-grasp
MNVLLYYPRLIAALLLRRPPRNHATLQHWVNAQLFWRWHQPWSNSFDTFGLSLVRLHALAKKRSFAAWHWKARAASSALRYVFLCLIFAWPLLAGLIVLRPRGRRFARWNRLVHRMRVIIAEPWARGSTIAEPLDCSDFFAASMYIYGRTGKRIPDRKNETLDACRRLGIPMPRAIEAGDALAPGQNYIVKPIDGCRAVGIHFTDEPEPYVGRADLIVQEVVRNSLDLRRLWGTDTLAAFRFITVITDDNDYEVVACILRVPIGDSKFDNTCKGNGYAAVDAHGTLQRMFLDFGPKAGFTHHPTTGERLEGTVIDGYTDCAGMAMKLHQSLAPGMPVLNSDIALTDDGPTLVEINRSPGQYEEMYCNGYSNKCVHALCRIVGLIHRDVAAWMRLSAEQVEDDFSGVIGAKIYRARTQAVIAQAEAGRSTVDHDRAEKVGSPT